MKPTPIQRFKIAEHTIVGVIDRALDAATRALRKHRNNVLTAIAVAALCGAYAVAGRIDCDDALAKEREASRFAEERAIAIAQWHRENTVRVTLEGDAQRVQTLAQQVANLPTLSPPIARPR